MTPRRGKGHGLVLVGILAVAVACGGRGAGEGSRHAISGKVTGAVADGVTVTISGSTSATTTTSGGGLYSFTGLTNGSYTVTPSLPGYTFTPSSIEVTLNGVDAAGEDFVSVLGNSVQVGDAIAVVGAQVTLSAVVTGEPGQVVTWSVDPGSLGSVSPDPGLTTTYTAPATPGKYEVWATSAGAAASVKGYAYVIVVPQPGSWRQLAALPMNHFNGNVVGVLAGSTGLNAVIEDDVYSGPYCWEYSVVRYDPFRDSWSIGPAQGIPTIYSCHGTTITDYAAAELNGKLYVLGGFQYYTIAGHNFSAVYPTVFQYDLALSAWNRMADLPTPRAGLAAVVAGQKLLAVGGYTVRAHDSCASTGGLPCNDYSPSAVVEEYDPVTNSWVARASLPYAVANPAAVAANDGIWVLGGDWSGWEGQGFLQSYVPSPSVAVFAYDPLVDEWSEPPQLSEAESRSAAITQDGNIYLLGTDQAGTIQELAPGGSSWSAPSHHPGLGSSAVAVNGHIYVIDAGAGILHAPTGVEEYAPPAEFGALSLTVGPRPFGACFDGTSLWVANSGSGSVSRFRAGTGELIGAYQVGSNPRGSIAFDGTSLWITNAGDDSVTRLRASDGASEGTFAVGKSPHGAAFDGASVWVANHDDGSVTRLRANDGAVLGTYAVGPGPTGVAYDGAGLWVSTSTEITHLSATGERIGAFTPVDDPYGIVFDGSSIWFANHGGNTVTKLRPVDGALLGSYVVGAAPLGVAASGTSVWVANSGDDTVTELRAGDGSTVCTLKTGATPYDVVIAEGHPWVTDYQGNDVRRLF